MVWVDGECSVGKTCPQVGLRRDAGTVLIQGWIADALGEQETAAAVRTVELPEWLLPGLADCGRPGFARGVRDGQRTVLVTGSAAAGARRSRCGDAPAREVIVEMPPAMLAGLSEASGAGGLGVGWRADASGRARARRLHRPVRGLGPALRDP